MKQKESNSKKNTFSNKTLSYLRGDEAKTSGHKFKGSVYAILIGLLIGIIPILISKGDPVQAYIHMFTDPFKRLNLNDTISRISIFILLGAGIGISFKTGLFNIGAPGQFLLGGAVTTMMGILLNLDKTLGLALMLIISMLVGAITAAIAGALKAFFNVHEVVSTILLNWVIFYIVKFIFQLSALQGSSSEASKMINDNMQFNMGLRSKEVWYIVIIAIVIIAVIWYIFKFTTFGYQLKVNGLNNNAAKYGGINTKLLTIYSMALSGALSGAAGFLYYNTIQGQMPALGSSIPTIGFEAITVTLLAFSSPLGAIISGAFYGTIKSGMDGAAAAANISKETIDLVLGLIILFAAIAPILIKVKPIEWIRHQIFAFKNTKIRESGNNSKLKIEKLKNDYKLRIIKTKEVLKRESNMIDKFIDENKKLLLKYKMDYDEQIKSLNQKLKIDIQAAKIKDNENKQTIKLKIKNLEIKYNENVKAYKINSKNKLSILKTKQESILFKDEIHTNLLKMKNKFKFDISNTKLTYTQNVTKVKSKFFKNIEEVVNLSRKNKPIIKFILNEKLSFALIKELQKQWSEDVAFINNKYSQKIIMLMERDSIIKNISNSYKTKIKELNVISVSELKNEKAALINESKKLVKLVKLDQWQSKMEVPND